MSNSLLYQYLKEKNDNKFIRNNIIYNDNDRKITINELYRLVNNHIKEIKRYKYKYINNPYFLTQNNIDTIAKFIAYLECGISPILLDGSDYYIKKTIRKKTINTEMILSGEARDKEEIVGINKEAFDKKKFEIQMSKTLGTPGKGKIGIFTSGSISEPKLVYIDEELIINNVNKSKNNNRYRKIYNSMPFNSVSGLFTNIFLPICAPLCEACLVDKFDLDDALSATDLFLPRNYQEIIHEIDHGNIEKVFMFGETNSIEVTNFLKEHLKVKRPIDFINVYGSTELGGLVSEHSINEKDEVTIYDYDIDKDIVIYSYDNQTFYKKEKDTITILNIDNIRNLNNNFHFKVIPCGTIDDNIIINNFNIGEGIINNYKTGDIHVNINNKIYVLGRKTDLINHTSLSYIDTKTTDLIGRKCTSFSKGNDIYLAVKYDLTDKESHDHTTFFRNLRYKAPKIIDKIYEEFPIIKDIFFIIDEDFPLSSKLKKVRRQELVDRMDKYSTINHRLSNYKAILTDYIEKTCMNYIGFIPKFTLSNWYDIIIPYDEINEEQLINLLGPLRIVAIDKQDDKKQYYICYDDSYFFGRKDQIDYTSDKLNEYRELSKYGLFINKLTSDKLSTTINGNMFTHRTLYTHNIYYYIAVGVNNDGDTIIAPYNTSIYNIEEPEDNEFIIENNRIIDFIFKDIPYEKYVIPVWTNDMPLFIDPQKDIITIKKDGKITGNDLLASSYLYHRDNNLLTKYNNQKIKKFII